MGRRIRIAKVIDGFDDPAAKQMEPNSIDNRAGEIRVLRRCQPGGQFSAPVAIGCHRGPAERSRPDRLPRARIDHLAGSLEVNNLRMGRDVLRRRLETRIEPRLDPREKRCHAGIIVGRPVFKGMVMALGTLKPHAAKKLADRLGLSGRVAADPVEIDRRVDGARTAGGQEFARHPIERRVRGKIGPQPLVQAGRALLLHRLAARAENVGPLERPEIGKTGRIEQPFDQPFALIRRRIAEKSASDGRRRHGAGDIQRRTAQKLGIGAQLRRDDL